MSDIHPTETVAPVVGMRKRSDDANLLAAEIAALAEMTYSDLRLAWRRHYRSHPPKKLSRDIIELGVAWKIQENALGEYDAPGAADPAERRWLPIAAILRPAEIIHSHQPHLPDGDDDDRGYGDLDAEERLGNLGTHVAVLRRDEPHT